MEDNVFGKRLLEVRNAAGIPVEELGGRLGVSGRAISRWEKGLSMPSALHLMKLSEIFNVPMEYFFAEQTVSRADIAPHGMESLSELYKTGRGPSSSHTMGPERACIVFGERNPNADRFKVILYGSLAKTGKGHGTDRVIQSTLAPVPCDIEFNMVEVTTTHPNTMEMFAFEKGVQTDYAKVYSVGGGRIVFAGDDAVDAPVVYEMTKFSDIADYCNENGLRIYEYAEQTEGREFLREYMHGIWEAMKSAVKAGLKDSGTLPGGLELQKKAKHLYNMQHVDEKPETREGRLVCSYAFAVSEQNASGERIVTAPTCGAAGVVPAVMYYQQKKNSFTDDEIVNALITGGIVGNLVKTNASISGAECGCQAEVGTACAMAAAALGELFGLNLDKIEYAAEIAIEHHLGLTCDPICGLVQIPCIERNAVAAMRAINAVNLASFLSDTRKISLDRVIITMKETGQDLAAQYRETSEGGLANIKL